MSDNRSYGRARIEVDALIYEAQDNTEIPCKIDNVSERGICFRISLPEPKCANLRVGDTLRFQFTDMLTTHSTDEEVILSHKCIIRHLTQDDDYLTVGCYVTEPEFEKYVILKKIAPLINKIQDV